MTELEREARDFICKKFSVTQEELENKNKDSDFINIIQNYVDLYIAGAKAHQTEWHDLRKNPNDLPEEEADYLLCLYDKDTKSTLYEVMGIARTYADREGWHVESMLWTLNDVVAWCEIPTFDKDKLCLRKKQNTKLKKQLENQNCSNCRRSKTGCPNDGSCHNFSLWQPLKIQNCKKGEEK